MPLNRPLHGRLVTALDRTPVAAGALGLGLGLFALVAWAVGQQHLSAWSPSFVAVKVNTAICLVALGLPLMARGIHRSREHDELRGGPGVGEGAASARPYVWLDRAGGLVAMVLSGVAFLEWATGWSSGVGELLFRDVGSANAGRMSLAAAVSIGLLGAALFTARHVLRLALAGISAMLAALALVGYAYGATALYSLGAEAIALPTALATLLLSLGITCLDGPTGICEVAVACTAGGRTFRRLAPAAVGVPFGVGWVCQWALERHELDAELGLALLATTSGILLFAVVSRLATWLHDNDARKLELLEVERRARHLLEESLAKTQEQEQFRDVFLGMLGHDLRNPLGAIMMSAQAMEMRGGLPDHVERSALRIISSSERMSRMVDQLLDMTRVRLGGGIPLRPREVDLTAMCRDAVEEARAAFPDHSFEVELAPCVWAKCDPDRLPQVLSNLLRNAVVHGASDGSIRLVLATAGDGARIAVHNDGEPIAPEELPRLFDPFSRTTPKERPKRRDGLGLGLFICHEIVAGHGGRLSVESTRARGTTFTVDLPSRIVETRPARSA